MTVAELVDLIADRFDMQEPADYNALASAVADVVGDGVWLEPGWWPCLDHEVKSHHAHITGPRVAQVAGHLVLINMEMPTGIYGRWAPCGTDIVRAPGLDVEYGPLEVVRCADCAAWVAHELRDRP